MCLDGAGCLVGSFDIISKKANHVISSTAMCAVAKATTLKGIWSRDFTCKRSIPL